MLLNAAKDRFSVIDPGYMSRKIRKFRTDKFDTYVKQTVTHVAHVNGWVPSVCNQYLHESKPESFVSRIELIISKLSNFSAHVSGINVCSRFHH